MGKVRDQRLRNITAAVTTVPDTFQTYAESQRSLYQTEIDVNFEYATDVFTVQEELLRGSMIFSDTRVRIVHIIEASTGVKLGDDFKEVIFPDMLHPKGMGMRYLFDNNYWLTINTDYYHFVTASTVIRRCNNTLNWLMDNGQVHQEVCVIEYADKSDTFEYRRSINIPRGDINVIAQCNQFTKNIQVDDRFLFNGQAFRCRFVNNYLHKYTLDNDSTPLIYLTMIKDNINAEDDILNNVANINKYQYSLHINEAPFEQSIGYIGQLTATLKLNDNVVTQPLIWDSSDINIATIDNSGNLSLLANGSVSITCRMQNNPIVNDSITVTITTVPSVDKQVIITPQQLQILQGKQVDYTVYKYDNDVQMPDTFTITATGVPPEYYILNVLSGNSFRVINLKMYTDAVLHIKCISNIDSSESDLDVSLKGLW
jgi:uncharacterized protein YjdB